MQIPSQKRQGCALPLSYARSKTYVAAKQGFVREAAYGAEIFANQAQKCFKSGLLR